jgi:putative tryptophan/tyrosine transport system substrate-binding protein
MTAMALGITSALVLMLTFAVAPAANAQARKTWRVGVLATANPRVYDDVIGELGKLGYVTGQNLVVESRTADGRAERLPALAAELVRAGVDVIVAGGGDAAARAALKATTTVPIVVVAIDYDPLALGLVKSLGRPGGNVTGVYLQQIELTGKRVEILKATLPTLTRLATLWEAASTDQFKAAGATAQSLGLQIQSLEMKSPTGEFRGALDTAVKQRAEALLVTTTGTFFRERALIVRLVTGARLPAMYPRREFVDAGGLMSYGPSVPEMFRRAATHVDKIFKGANAGDVPMEQPTRFELVINMKAARALGLTIPSTVLARTDQIIE